MSGATVVLALRNRYIRIFRKAGAIDVASAISPSEHGIRTSLIFHGLVRRGILIKVNNDRYYLNEKAATSDRKRRLTIVLILLAIVFVVVVLFVRR